MYLAVGVVPATIRFVGRELMPDLEHPEQILPLFAQCCLPRSFYMRFAGALVSAILSTVDSALLVASVLVSHNVGRRAPPYPYIT